MGIIHSRTRTDQLQLETMNDPVIFWDFHGTLAHRQNLWSSAILRLLFSEGEHGISQDTLISTMRDGFPWHHPERPHRELLDGKSWWDYVCGFVGERITNLGVSEKAVQAVTSGLRDEVVIRGGYTLYEDTVPALQSAENSGFKNAILSNHFPEIEQVADDLDISRYFVSTFTSGTIGYEKPHSKIFRHAVEHLGNPNRMVMIGDNYRADIEGAERLGIPAILVRTTNEWQHPLHLDDLNDLPRLLEQLFR